MIFSIKYSTRRCQKQQAHFPKVIARWQHLALNLLGWWPQFLVIPGTTWYLPTRWQQGHSRSSHYLVCVEWVRVVHIMNNFHGSTKKMMSQTVLESLIVEWIVRGPCVVRFISIFLPWLAQLFCRSLSSSRCGATRLRAGFLFWSCSWSGDAPTSSSLTCCPARPGDSEGRGLAWYQWTSFCCRSTNVNPSRVISSTWFSVINRC